MKIEISQGKKRNVNPRLTTRRIIDDDEEDDDAGFYFRESRTACNKLRIRELAYSRVKGTRAQIVVEDR